MLLRVHPSASRGETIKGEGAISFRAIIVLAAFAAVALLGSAAKTDPGMEHRPKPAKRSVKVNCEDAKDGIRFYRGRADYWRSLKGDPPQQRVKWPNCKRARAAAQVWKIRAQTARQSHERYLAQRRAYYRGLYEKWRCIHEHEGAWDSNTGNGYYGGLQMDITFQLSHGRRFYERWGTANYWPVWAQLAAAEDAYHSGRGFAPWPNTSRMCGLR